MKNYRPRPKKKGAKVPVKKGKGPQALHKDSGKTYASIIGQVARETKKMY